MKTARRMTALIVAVLTLTACSATDLSESHQPARDAGTDTQGRDATGDPATDVAAEDTPDTESDLSDPDPEPEPDAPDADLDAEADASDAEPDATDPADADPDPDAAQDADDAGDVPEAPATWEQFCDGEGTNLCDGEFGQVAFRFALCTCEDLQPQSTLTIDAFDSDEAPFEPGGPGGSFGTNGVFDSPAQLDITGSSYVGGDRGLRSSSTLVVGQNLYCAGPVHATAGLGIAQDAFVDGDVTSASSVRIGGTLHAPAGAEVRGSHPEAVQIGDRVEEPVSVEPPCDCGDDRLDVAAHVARFAQANDNLAAGVTQEQFSDLVGEQEAELPCGRLYFDAVSVEGSLSLRLSGRTSIYVGGDFTTAGGLTIELGPGAEVDLFVAGNLQLGGGFLFGDPSAPWRARAYVGGDDAFIRGTTAIGGNLAAPNATLEFLSDTEMYGAVAAHDILLEGQMTIHHDLAVLRAGDNCTEPIEEERLCKSCRECGNQACVDGACAPCGTDSDCCAPLVCAEGRCVLR
jgi:hypothetical protein